MVRNHYSQQNTKITYLKLPLVIKQVPYLGKTGWLHFTRISMSHFARNGHGLIKLWYINHSSLSRKTIIRWSTHKLILYPHDIRSWNMTSCYLANLDGSSNKQFSKGSHTHTHTHARTHARTHAHTRTHTHTYTHTHTHTHTQTLNYWNNWCWNLS